MTRLSAAARTRTVRKIVGRGPAITSTPASHKAYNTTVHVADVDDRDALWGVIQVGLPTAEVEKYDGFLTITWPEP